MTCPLLYSFLYVVFITKFDINLVIYSHTYWDITVCVSLFVAVVLCFRDVTSYLITSYGSLHVIMLSSPRGIVGELCDNKSLQQSQYLIHDIVNKT